jgi:nitrous oxidase accessory protein
MTGLVLAAALALGGQADMAAPAAAMVDGRPASREASPIQRLVDAAATGSTVEIPSGRYVGDVIVDRPMRIVGRGRPLLVGSTTGSVVRVRASNVVIEGFDIDGLGGGDLGRDASGIHVAGHDVVVRDCRISNALFGVYLREADGAIVERVTIRGIPGRDPGEKGSGIHVWNTDRFRLIGNDIADVRDGFYIQSSSHGFISGNSARDLRYGIHYMFSDDNTFEDNSFENGAAGVALMYSRRIAFRRNRFLHNRGFASVGLLLKACDEVTAEDNLIADNARGIFLEGSYRNRFERNIVAESDTAIVLYDSAAQNVFAGNSFVANLTPLSLVGKRTDTVFDGNYWSDHHEPDLDGDGRADRPYRLSSVFDHLRSNLTAADLFTQGIAAAALGAAERTFPVLDAVAVEDRAPLSRPPALPNVPRARGATASSVEPRASGRALGLVLSAIALAIGLSGLSRLRPSHRTNWRATLKASPYTRASS